MATATVTSLKLKGKDRTSMNNKLADLSSRRHTGLPMADVTAILAQCGLEIEDALYCGLSGRANLDLTHKATGMEISNSMLVMTWYREPSQTTYEVVLYLS